MDKRREILVAELDAGIDTNAINSPYYRRSTGAIDDTMFNAKATDASNIPNIVMRGYVSTNSPDLSNEVIVPNSWEKNLIRYKANPIFCWMHDKKMPIGKVNSLHIDERGLYLDEIEIIGEIPIVREFLGPLLRNGVLRQMSVGFLSLEGHYDNGLWYHDLNYLLENSLVSIACQPEAEAEIVRGFAFAKSAGVSTLDELVRSYHYGVIGESDRRKHYIMGHKAISMTAKEDSPDFTEVSPTKDDVETVKEFSVEFSDGTVTTSRLPKYHKDYDKFGKVMYAGYNASSKTYMFPFAIKVEGGFSYNFDSLAVSMCRLLGAKGKAAYEPESYKGLIDRLCYIYGNLNKKVPTVNLLEGGEVPIDEVAVEFINEVEYKNVTFYEKEDVIFATTVLRSDLKNIANFVNSLKDEKEAKVLEALKDFYTMVDIWGFIEGPEDAAMLAEVLGLLTPISEEPEEDIGEPGAYSGEPYKEIDLTDAVKQFQEALNAFRK